MVVTNSSSLDGAAHTRRLTREELSEEFLLYLAREAEYKRLRIEIVKVRDRMLDRIMELGLDPRKVIDANHPKIPADLREWLYKQSESQELKAMNDRTVKLFQNNVVMNKAEYARMLFEKGAAPGISSGQTQGEGVLVDAKTFEKMAELMALNVIRATDNKKSK